MSSHVGRTMGQRKHYTMILLAFIPIGIKTSAIETGKGKKRLQFIVSLQIKCIQTKNPNKITIRHKFQN